MKIRVKIQDKTFTVKIGDIHARPIQAEVDGEIFEVWPQEAFIPPNASRTAPPAPQVTHTASPSESTTAQIQPTKSSKHIAAPIPGVIVEIAVKVGEQVAHGQELCTLEAMKMKNSIRANREGKIKKVLIKVGDHVHQSQVLMEFD